MILECGLGPYIGLPKSPDVESLKRVWTSASKGNAKYHKIKYWGQWRRYGAHTKLSCLRSPNIIFPILDGGIRTECAPPTLLASLLQNTEEMMVLHHRLKLSSFERDMALFVIEHRNDADMKGNKEWRLCHRYGFTDHKSLTIA